MSKKALGKGLDALFGSDEFITKNLINDEDKVIKVKIDKIERNPDQPRKNINIKEIESLANSIKEKGLLQPILVVKKNEKYMIVAGERRFLAAKKAGLEEIPVIAKKLDDQEILEIALIENIQREDLNPIEEAMAFNALIGKYKLTHEELAKRIGKSRVYITNSLRLLKLNSEERNFLLENKISKGHAIALLQIDDSSIRKELINEIIEKNLSVREVEKIVSKLKKKSLKDDNAKEKVKVDNKSNNLEEDVFLKDIEDKLTYKFGIKVKIIGSLNKGKIILEYSSKDDLEKILG